MLDKFEINYQVGPYQMLAIRIFISNFIAASPSTVKFST